MGLRKFFRSRFHAKEKQVQVGNYSLTANYEHPVEEYLTAFKYYSRNLPRIAKYIESKYPVFSIIDVGANIGDTVALLRTEGVKQPVHCVEGDPMFLGLFEKNIPQFTDVSVYRTFLGEENSKKSISIANSIGTAKINMDAGNLETTIVTLDHLVDENKIGNIKLLKTDTDGFDFKILRGSFETIRKHKPVLFFEYDANLLEEQGDEGLTIFTDFENAGYNKIFYYDNFGKFLTCIDISQKDLIRQLYNYVKKDGAFPYFDLCMLHKDDEDLSERILQEEQKFYKF